MVVAAGALPFQCIQHSKLSLSKWRMIQCDVTAGDIAPDQSDLALKKVRKARPLGGLELSSEDGVTHIGTLGPIPVIAFDDCQKGGLNDVAIIQTGSGLQW